MQQASANISKNVSTTSSEIMHRVGGKYRRTQMIISNTSAAAVITLRKGDDASVSGEGIQLLPNGTYAEATDGGYECWQGAVQAIGDIAGTLGIVESFIIED